MPDHPALAGLREVAAPFNKESLRMQMQRMRQQPALRAARPLPSAVASALMEKFPDGLPSDHPLQAPGAFDKYRADVGAAEWIQRLVKLAQAGG